MIQHLSSRQMSVGTAAASVCEGYVAGTEVHLHALANNSKDVLIGSSDLTLANGFVLRKGEHITIRLMERQTLYAISENNGQILTVLAVGGI
jgi:hypothetical protein